MDPFFFRVEHDLLRSESFQTLGGSAIKIVRQAPARPPVKKGKTAQIPAKTVPEFLEDQGETGPKSLDLEPRTGPDSLEVLAQFLGAGGPEDRPKREQETREDSTSIPIPGTPFRLSAE